MRTLLVAVTAPAAVLLVLGAPAPAAGVGPEVRVVPSPVSQGTTTTAFVSGFCPRPCGPVRLVVGDTELASGRARDDGTLRLPFTVKLIPGQYPVVASQDTPSGPRRATVGLVVLAADSPADVRPTRVDPELPVPPPRPPATRSADPQPTTSVAPPPSPHATRTTSPRTSPASITAGAHRTVAAAATGGGTTGGPPAGEGRDWLGPAVLAAVCAAALGLAPVWLRRRRRGPRHAHVM